MHLKSALLVFGVMLVFLLIRVPAEDIDQDDVKNFLEAIADDEDSDRLEDELVDIVKNNDDDDDDNDEHDVNNDDNDDDEHDTDKVADPKARWGRRRRRFRLPRFLRVRIPRRRFRFPRFPRVRIPRRRFRLPRIRRVRLPWGKK